MPERFEANEADPTTTSVFKTVGGDSDVNIARRALKPEEQAAIESLPKGSALLIALSGPNSGARFLLNEDRTNAGRHQRSDIFLDDATVSRKHAQFIREGGTFFVRDSGSLNGTYVNRERIDSHVLETGDEVQIGKYRMTYHPGPQSGAASR